MLTEVTESNDKTQVKDVRKPYQKPEVIYRAPLEAMAGFCGNPPTGKAVQGVGGCGLGQS